MTRSALALALTVAISVAIPAIALVSPALAQTVSADDTRDVTGTFWNGPAVWANGEAKVWTLTFRSDGVLFYSYDGQVYDNGRWMQRDRLVIFHTNNYFSVYTGVLDESGRTISGHMHNVRGNEGTFEFQLDQ